MTRLIQGAQRTPNSAKRGFTARSSATSAAHNPGAFPPARRPNHQSEYRKPSTRWRSMPEKPRSPARRACRYTTCHSRGLVGNSTFSRPGPDFSEQFAVQPGPPQIMQQAGDLVGQNPAQGMAKPQRDRSAHTSGPQRMGPVIPADSAPRLARMRHVVQLQQGGGKRPRDQEGRRIPRRRPNVDGHNADRTATLPPYLSPSVCDSHRRGRIASAQTACQAGARHPAPLPETIARPEIALKEIPGEHDKPDDRRRQDETKTAAARRP
jgi:hypothetical protein